MSPQSLLTSYAHKVAVLEPKQVHVENMFVRALQKRENHCSTITSKAILSAEVGIANSAHC